MSTVIQDLPPPPQPSDTPSQFNSKAFSLLGALPGFVAQTNALGAEVEQYSTAAVAAKNAAGASESAARGSEASSAQSSAAAIAARDAAQGSATTASAAAQRAEQSAASIDPIKSEKIDATSLQDFFTKCLAKGSGFYRADGANIPIEMRYCPGWFSKTQDTWSFIANRYDSGRPVFFSGRFEDIPTGTWKQYDPMARGNHTGTQEIGSVDGLQTALDARIQQTAVDGAAVLPEGPDAKRPASGSIPAGAFVVRGSTQDGADYKGEFWDRVAAAWKVIADRTWVGLQITAAMNSVKAWVNQLIGFVIIYPNSGSPASPANVSVNSRYVSGNPFGSGHVICIPEFLYNGVWSDPGWDGDTGTSGHAAGARATHITSATINEIIVQTGTSALLVASNLTGGGHGLPAGTNVLTAQLRVKVFYVKGGE